MSNATPADFSASTFLYLNPEVTALSNVVTVEDAYERYASDFSHLYYTIPEPALEGPFVADVYIAEHRGVIDVSRLNQVIQLADQEILGGEETNLAGRFVPNFFRNIRLDSENVFSIIPVSLTSSTITPCGDPNADNVKFNSCNLNVGDEVKVLKNDGRSVIFGNIAEIIDDESFRLEPQPDDLDNSVPVTDSNADYVLFGIRITDADRIAHINYTRRFYQGFSNEAPTQLLEPFNTELYQVLYPDARFLTEEEAFVSSRNNWTTNECRITKASDILNTNDPVIETLAITSNTVITSNASVTWGDVSLAGGISTDDVTGSSNVAQDTLITEWAIKKYVERPYNTTATFNDIVINGAIELSGHVNMSNGDLDASTIYADALNVGQSNLVVGESSMRVLSSDFECSCNIVCAASGFANMLFAGTRLGVGGGTDNIGTWPSKLDDFFSGGNQDRGAKNLEVDDKLTIGHGKWQIRTSPDTGNLTVSHATALQHPLVTLTSNAPEGGRGGVFIDGDIFSSGIIASLSDVRKKRDIRPIRDALHLVRRLNGYTYSSCPPDREYDQVRREMGVMAQEVVDVVPEAVHLNNTTGSMSVAYGNLCGLLIESIKDLSTQVERLEKKFATLRSS
jgi:hypothetical protein